MSVDLFNNQEGFPYGEQDGGINNASEIESFFDDAISYDLAASNLRESSLPSAEDKPDNSAWQIPQPNLIDEEDDTDNSAWQIPKPNLIEEDDDADAFEKLEADGSIDGLIIPLQYTDPISGEVVEMWGSIDQNGLFDIIDIDGKTHPLMHPMALEACLEIALDWEYIDRNQAQQITQSHLTMAEKLHTPQIIDMMDGNQIAQVMTGYAELASRYKVGAYGAMGMNSQGEFVNYVSHFEIMDIMTEAAKENPGLQTDIENLIEFNGEIIKQMSGELAEHSVDVNASQSPAYSEQQTTQATEKKLAAHAPPEQTSSGGGPNQVSAFERFNQSFNPNPSSPAL